MRMVENVKTVSHRVQAAATAYDTSTEMVDMADYHRCNILLGLEQAGAGTATVTLKQGVSGGAGTALAFSEYWKNEAGTDALTHVAATTLTTAGAFTGMNMYQFEVQDTDLERNTANNKFIRMNVASISNNTAAFLTYRLSEPVFSTSGGEMVTAES